MTPVVAQRPGKAYHVRMHHMPLQSACAIGPLHQSSFCRDICQNLLTVPSSMTPSGTAPFAAPSKGGDACVKSLSSTVPGSRHGSMIVSKPCNRLSTNACRARALAHEVVDIFASLRCAHGRQNTSCKTMHRHACHMHKSLTFSDVRVTEHPPATCMLLNTHRHLQRIACC